MTEQEYKKKIGQRLREIFDTSNYTQAQIVEMCASKGVKIKAPDISKLKNGESLSLYKIAGLCEILDYDIGEVLSLDPDEKMLSKSEKAALPHIAKPIKKNYQNVLEAICDEQKIPIIYDIKNDELQQWTGRYYCYFFPTVKPKTNSPIDILEGKMFIGCNPIGTVENPTGQCMVSFELDTKKSRNMDKAENSETPEAQTNIKRYFGTFALSSRLNTAHITLIETKVGEISYLSMINPGTLYEGVRCQIALALTVSSGSMRAPTVHRMLICRDRLAQEQLNKLCGLLFMNSSESIIKKEDYEKLLNDPRCPYSYKECFLKADGSFWFPFDKTESIVYTIPDHWIRGSKLPYEDQLIALNLLKEYSVSRHYYKLSSRVGVDFFEFIKCMVDD